MAVEGGVVHFATGMWSSEGVYVYALDAKSGKEIWCNDANLHYLPMPHASTAHTGNMPQGYAAASKSIIAFGNGQASVWLYDRRTGKGKGLQDNLGEGGRNTSGVVAILDDGTIYHGCKAGQKGKLGRLSYVINDREAWVELLSVGIVWLRTLRKRGRGGD